jgi:hypothetical protein
MNAETAICLLVEAAKKSLGCGDPDEDDQTRDDIDEAAEAIRAAIRGEPRKVSKKDALRMLRSAPTTICSYCHLPGHNRRGCAKLKAENLRQ